MNVCKITRTLNQALPTQQRITPCHKFVVRQSGVVFENPKSWLMLLMLRNRAKISYRILSAILGVGFVGVWQNFRAGGFSWFSGLKGTFCQPRSMPWVPVPRAWTWADRTCLSGPKARLKTECQKNLPDPFRRSIRRDVCAVRCCTPPNPRRSRFDPSPTCPRQATHGLPIPFPSVGSINRSKAAWRPNGWVFASGLQPLLWGRRR